MENLIKKLEELRQRFLHTKALLDIERKIVQEKELRLQTAAPDFWSDREAAVKVGQEVEELATEIKEWQEMEVEIREAEEMAAMAQKEAGGELTSELEIKYEELEKKFSHLEFLSLFSGEYDHDNALLSLHSGTGGVDAQDWTQMLERMYLRFAERENWKVEILDRNYGNEAGLKSVVLRVAGPWAYGYLKSENGVHRLLRNSPFNADGLRQTSFALAEVIPEIKDEEAMPIKDEDLRIDVFRSSGPGGQSVNTTDSAVRIVHLPSGITISCQTERSQHQNKENAMRILKTKLAQIAREEKEAQERKLRGELTKAEWGRQIRSYFLYGNRLVKDHRTNYETSNVDVVLDGDLEPFMEAYLRWLKESK
ncbi:MAG: peptide chain release factor 2 [Candidatus Falkowbacteria bacterium]